MATSYQTPGVYVEEMPPGSRPIEGVGTSVAAFVGFAEMGPRHKPTLVTNWSQFVDKFGSFHEGYYLAHSVYGYFSNGGGGGWGQAYLRGLRYSARAQGVRGIRRDLLRRWPACATARRTGRTGGR